MNVKTSEAVWREIHASHRDLIVYSSYTAPLGDQFGNPLKGVIMTEYAFPFSDKPFIGAKKTWDIDPENSSNRKNEVNEYWFCVETGDGHD